MISEAEIHCMKFFNRKLLHIGNDLIYENGILEFHEYDFTSLLIVNWIIVQQIEIRGMHSVQKNFSI